MLPSLFDDRNISPRVQGVQISTEFSSMPKKTILTKRNFDIGGGYESESLANQRLDNFRFNSTYEEGFTGNKLFGSTDGNNSTLRQRRAVIDNDSGLNRSADPRNGQK
mmetsp:Transcript_5994/g.10185  ORF Transcript_5994/g.10185 Transcript_5994/m.10185 type:complete len:108 (+) Transcript_5994:82-405(+)